MRSNDKPITAAKVRAVLRKAGIECQQRIAVRVARNLNADTAALAARKAALAKGGA